MARKATKSTTQIPEPEPSPPDPDTKSQKIPYPKVVLLILGNELCERFAFYGMKAVLSLYMVIVLHFSKQHATVVYHLFVALAYFTPILGGCISDNWLGKFNTIVYLSLIYVTGQTLLSITSAPIGIPQVYFSLISLLLIALGTGGIKPCVAAYGGDQFTLPQHRKYLDDYFFFFYFSINIGAALSTFLTPLLRDLTCLGEDTCFPLAFGVPAVLMVVAVIIFVVGKPCYKNNPAAKAMTRVVKCICHGMHKLCHHAKGERVNHWLDRAGDKYDAELIMNIKDVFAITIFLVPGIVFWALYDQSGSTWTFQACRMDGNVFGSFVLLPDQVQMINPILVLVLIPIFNLAVYPLFMKMNMLKKTLSRMAVGGFLLTISFAIVSIISLILEKSDPVMPKERESHLRIYNALQCTPTLTTAALKHAETIDPLDYATFKVRRIQGEATYDWTITNCDALPEKQGKFDLKEKGNKGYYLSKQGMISFEDDITKDEQMSGYPKLRVLVDDPSVDLDLDVKRGNGGKADLRDTVNVDAVKPKLNEIIQFTLRQGSIKIRDLDKELQVKQGGVYVLFVETEEQSIKNATLIVVTKPNSLNLLWQLPQYIICTIGEVMFSISSLEFAYSQAPYSMKSFVQALQLMTTFFGNLLTTVITAIGLFENDSSNQLFYTASMLVVMLVFSCGIGSYKYVENRLPAPDLIPYEI